MALNQVDRGYAAGFFDGEGCVNITRTENRVGAFAYRLQLLVTQADQAPLRWFQERFGGRLYEVPNNRSQLTDYPRTCWALHIHGEEAAATLRELEPLLILKREQAQNALAFIAVKAEGRRYRKTPTDVLSRLAALHARHRQLSTRFDTPVDALLAAPDDDQLELHIG